jgi:hypothetical protein
VPVSAFTSLAFTLEQYADSDTDHEEKDSSSHITLCKAAATVKYADENGLDLDDGAVIRSAGKHGSLKALAKIYELNGNWNSSLTNGAAARGMCALAAFHDCHSSCRSPGFATC